MVNAQEWLSRGINIQKEIDALRRAREIAFTKATKETYAPKEVNVQTSGKTSNEHEFVKYADYGTELDKYLSRLEEVRCEILKVIQGVNSSEQRTVLVHRYINGLSWDDISELTGFSRQTVVAYHGQALKEIKNFLKLDGFRQN